MKENEKNTKRENLQNGQEKHGGKNLAYVSSSGKNSKKIIISSNLSLKLLLTVIKINFLPKSVYICLKKH